MSRPAENAELALLLEVAGTPKPGSVDRHRDLSDLRFEQFLAGAVGARAGLARAAAGDPIGEAFESAVAGMSERADDNTQFGCLLLLVPLVAAAADGDLSPEGVDRIVASTTVDDAAAFYRAFEHVDVAVDDPPEDADAIDVRRGAAAVPAVRERGLTLRDVLATNERDRNAREWTTGFRATFDAAERLRSDEGPILDRVARVFLHLLAAEPDTLVRIRHGGDAARDLRRRAAAVGDDLEAAERLAEELVAEGINPGTTADLTSAALFVALERGVEV